MKNRLLLARLLLLFALFSIGYTWNHFHRDFLFLPKLTRAASSHRRSNSYSDTSETATDSASASNSAPASAIFKRERLDPSNSNVYQDSATVKVKKQISKNNNSAQQTLSNNKEEEFVADENYKVANDSNAYVPVMSSRVETPLINVRDRSNDLSLNGNNFPDINIRSLEDLINVDLFSQNRPRKDRQNYHNNHRNDYSRASRHSRDSASIRDTINRDFEDLFSDFFNTELVI